nr:MAG TPA: hypothetical protein [Caudoviricetes sp.]
MVGEGFWEQAHKGTVSTADIARQKMTFFMIISILSYLFRSPAVGY